MKPRFRLLVHGVGICLALGLAGCATPDYRIKKHPEMFAAFPPEVQAKVRQGQVDLGFTPDMVFIALGEPARKYTRRTTGGVNEVWAYTQFYTTMERQYVQGNFRVRDGNRGYRTVYDSVWVDVEQRHEYERLRVEFENGAVKALENLQR